MRDGVWPLGGSDEGSSSPWLYPLTLGLAVRGLAVAAWQMAGAVALGHAAALLKSEDIAARVVRGWQQAWRGTLYMQLDEALAHLRTRLSCRSPASLLALERDLLRISMARSLERAAMLGRMVVQGLEDISVPLWRRCDPAVTQGGLGLQGQGLSARS